jgi:hypothetical protein
LCWNLIESSSGTIKKKTYKFSAYIGHILGGREYEYTIILLVEEDENTSTVRRNERWNLNWAAF